MVKKLVRSFPLELDKRNRPKRWKIALDYFRWNNLVATMLCQIPWTNRSLFVFILSFSSAIFVVTSPIVEYFSNTRQPFISYTGHFLPLWSCRTHYLVISYQLFGHFEPSNNHFVPRSFNFVPSNSDPT